MTSTSIKKAAVSSSTVSVLSCSILKYKSFKDLKFLGDAANVNYGRLFGLTALASPLFQEEEEYEKCAIIKNRMDEINKVLKKYNK